MAENDLEFLKNNRSEPTLTWIGHSTLLLQFEGLDILTDPHMTRRASPVSFAGLERYMKHRISIEDLPHIDLIVISHNHYDHLDRLINQKEWFEDLEIPNVVEMDW